jgi:bifunctional non-homologous end joining protein LigD
LNRVPSRVPSRTGAEQLSLEIETSAATGLPDIRPMLPQAADAPFDDPEWFFEPWWPGASALAYLDGARLRLQIGHLADPLDAFPELAVIGGQFRADRLIVEGALLVLDDEGRPDAELLRRRLADVGNRDGSPAFVASDLLYLGSRQLLNVPFEERRDQLTRQLSDAEHCVVSRGLRGEGLTLAEAVSSMGFGEISARLLAGRYRPGQRDESWLRLPVIEAPVVPTRPLLALLQRLPL